MGVVYRYTHPRLENPVAIKVLDEPYSGDPNCRQRLHREAATAAAPTHTALVRGHDLYEGEHFAITVKTGGGGRRCRPWPDRPVHRRSGGVAGTR